MSDPVDDAVDQARRHADAQDFARAIATLRAAALLAARCDPPRPLRAARLRAAMAVLYVETRSLRKAQYLARSALRGFQRHDGTPVDIAGALNTVANASWHQGDAAAALAGYQRALDHYRQGQATPDDLARISVNMTLPMFRLGRDDEIGPTLHAALGLALSPRQRAEVEYRLAVHYDRTGKFGLAAHAFERLLPCAAPEDVPHVLASLAMLKDRLGEAATSVALLRQAVAAVVRLPTRRHQFVNVVCTYAAQAAALGDHHEARKALRRARGWAAHRTPQDEEWLLSAQATVALSRGVRRSPPTLRLLERARRATYGDGHPFVLETRTMLAEQLSERDPARAFAHLARAIERCSAPPSNVEIVVAKAALAGIALRQHRPDIAGPLARETVVREAAFGAPALRWRALALVAFATHHAGSIDAAILLMKIAAEIASRVLLRTPDRATFQAVAAERPQLVYANLVAWLVAAGRLPEAERLHLTERGMASLTLTRRRTDGDEERVPTPMTPDERGMADELADIGIAWRANIGERERAGLAVAAGDLAHPSAAQMTAWLARAEAFRLAHQGDADPELAAQAGGDRDVLLHYLVADGKVTAVARSLGAEARAELDGSDAAINAECFEFRQAILARSATVDTLARRLFDRLVGPVWDVVADAATLHLVPDGALRYLPFCALRNDAGYLVETMPIQYVPVVRSAARPATEPRRWRVAGLGTSELAYAKAELEAIPRANATTILLDAQFDRQGFAAALAAGAEIVHVVSHFHLDPANVDRSSLAIGNGDSMRLEELRDRCFDFSHVELLILSACDTATVGLGRTSSESLAGLFQIQGARRVLATLWPVADDGAAELTTRFYRALAGARNQSLSASLRDAQLAMIHSRGAPRPAQLHRGGFGLATGASTRHPYFWASHVLYST